MELLFIGGIGATEMLLIVLVLLLLFGGTKLPQLMRGAGKGIREFKDAMDGKNADKDEEKKSSESVDEKQDEKE